MGALISRLLSLITPSKQAASASSSTTTTTQSGGEAPKVYSWDLRKPVDPKDYTIEHKKGEKIVKMPGSINGNQFIIKNLEDCSVFIFDNMAVLSIDDCKNCKFFLGPCKGSLFIRNSTDCVVASICQQYRTRDCKNVTTFIICTSMPIIESSTQMKFGCLTCNYNDLNEQLKKANVSVFNSNWSTIHDFTRIPGQSNYTTLDKSHKLTNYLEYPEASIKNQLGLTYEIDSTFVPYTVGSAAKLTNESCLIILFFDPTNPSLYESHARNIIKAIRSNYPDIWLINSKNFNLSEISAENIFGSKTYNQLLQKGSIIGLEFNGPDSINKCQIEVQKLKIDNNHAYVSPPSDNLQQRIDNFYNYSDMQMFG